MKVIIYRYKIKFMVMIAFCTVITSGLYCQNPPDLSGKSYPEKELNIPSALYQLYVEVSEKGISANEAIQRKGLIGNNRGEVNIIIENLNGDKPIDSSFIKDRGATYDTYWRNLVSLYIKPELIVNLSENLPEGFRIQAVIPSGIEDEGPGLTGSDSYAQAGADGTGIKVAIIDHGYDSLTEVRNAGLVPQNYHAWDFTGTGLQNTARHGTGCFETFYDHAPGASYYIFKIKRNSVSLAQAVDSCIAHGVNIISHSLSSPNQGWEDGSGTACAAVKNATDNDILFFTAAGNYGIRHWRGAFSDQNNDSWHEWSVGDQSNSIVVPAEESISLALQWDLAPGSTDLDLYLTDGGELTLASSTSGGTTYEFLSWENTGPANQTVFIFINKQAGANDPDFQIFVRGVGGPLEHFTSAGSIISPANSLEANCISVGAVKTNLYSVPPNTSGIIEFYSSQGPTNSGNLAPDVVAPTGTTTLTYGGSFFGTSCATPNMAGTAACLWSSDMLLSPSAIRYILLEMANVYKDWGDPGHDNIYGRGGIKLLPYTENTLWLDRRYCNDWGVRSDPFYFVQDALDAAVQGGRLVFFGQQYPEPVILDKNLIIISLKYNAILGN